MAVSVFTTPEGVHIFRVRGKLSANSIGDLKTALDAAGERAYAVINLKGAPMLDSVSIGYLVRRHSVLWRGGGAMALCCLHPMVSKLLAMAGLNKHFTVHEGEEDAVAALKKSFTGPVPQPKKRGRKPKGKEPETPKAEEKI